MPPPRKGRTPDVVYFWQVDFKTIKSVRFDSKHIEPICDIKVAQGKSSSMFEKGASAILAVQVPLLILPFG